VPVRADPREEDVEHRHAAARERDVAHQRSFVELRGKLGWVVIAERLLHLDRVNVVRIDGKRGNIASDDVVVLTATAGRAHPLGRTEEQLVHRANIRLWVIDRHEAVVAPPQMDLRPIKRSSVGRRAQLLVERHGARSAGQCDMRRAALGDGFRKRGHRPARRLARYSCLIVHYDELRAAAGRHRRRFGVSH